MKKIPLSVVLGVTAVAVALSTTPPSAQGQSATPPAQAQTAAPAPAQAQGQAAAPATAPAAAPAQAAAPTQAPVIKDPAEYNAYVAAVDPKKDANARISGLEAFLAQYPNSIMKNQALEVLLATYQQAGNVKKAMETATKLVAAEPCPIPALFLLTYVNRVTAQSGDANGKQESADAGKYGQLGLDCLPKFLKPEGTSPEDFKKQQDTMKENFLAGVGWAALQAQDYAKAEDFLKQAINANPPESQSDLGLIFPLATAFLKQTPVDYQNGIWWAARAAGVATPAQNQPALEKYAHGQYIKYRLDEEGWPELMAAAKAGPNQVPIKPPLTPADQAHKMVADTADSAGKLHPEKMDFATWEFVLSNGSQQDQDVVWNGVKDQDGKAVVEGIKGKAVQMNGTVISTEPTEFKIAGSSDDIDAKKADITLQFEDKIPVRLIPKDGASFDFQGEPASYTASPFMMVMEKGRLLNAKPAAPAHRPAAAHKPAAHQ